MEYHIETPEVEVEPAIKITPVGSFMPAAVRVFAAKQYRHLICEKLVSTQPVDGLQYCPICGSCPPAAEFEVVA